MAGRAPRQQRSTQRREALIAAAAWAIEEYGPAACSARTVAAAADLPLASVSYYFPHLNELLGLGTARLADGWLRHGRAVAAARQGTGPAVAAETLTDALLPSGDRTALLARYEQLLAAARIDEVAAAVAQIRPALEELISDILRGCRVSTRLSPATVLAVVDGAVVGALSELRTVPSAVVRAALEDLLG